MKLSIKSIYLLIVIFLLNFGTSAIAQEFVYVTAEEYTTLKLNGQLTGNEVPLTEGMVKPDQKEIFMQTVFTPKALGCSGYFPPPGPAHVYTASDDGGSVFNPISLPFDFCFFGDIYNEVYLNNNGNISFNGPITAFTSDAFPSLDNVMIAPFWADVDFGGAGSFFGTVTSTAAIFNWVGVGYYSSQSDKLNTFQVIITDGNDPLIVDGNVALHYEDMQWTTGSASSGVNGFGGTPATVGANRGNNLDYFQIGRFDHAGTDYDGPAGANDGVSWLDNKSFFFDFCTTVSGNLEPIPLQTAYCDTIRLCDQDDTLQLSFPFLSPENDQITTVTYSAPTLTNVQVISNVAGVNGEITLQIIGAQETVGIHEIEITATDNFSTPGVTTVLYILEIIDNTTVFITEPEISYTYGCAPVTIEVLNGPFDFYTWQDNSSLPTYTHMGGANENVSVLIEKDGCKILLDSIISMPMILPLNVSQDFVYCENDGGTFVEILDSLNFSQVTWGLSDPIQDAMYSNFLQEGVFTITAVDTSGFCTTDTTFTVSMIVFPTVTIPEVGCDLTTFEINSTYPPGSTISWTFVDNPSTAFLEDTAVTFLDPTTSTSQNPFVNVSQHGTYTVLYNITGDCPLSGSGVINFPPYLYTEIGDTNICIGVEYELGALVSPYDVDYSWSTGETSVTSIMVSTPGVYTVTINNECYTFSDDAVITTYLCDIEAPNVISLSSTSGNNTWFVEADGIADFECTIVNRWGHLVYEFNDANGSWNGKDMNGRLVEEGVYFYNIKATAFGGEEVLKHGFITVVH